MTTGVVLGCTTSTFEYRDRPPGAVEVTSAADSASIELWNVVNHGGRWIDPGLQGGWLVELLPTARGRRVIAELPRVIAELEGEGVRHVDARHGRQPWTATVAALGIAGLHQHDTDFPGSLYPSIRLPRKRVSGFIADTGDALAEWLGGFLRGPNQRDNLEKLPASRAHERHIVVIFPGFADAPFDVTSLLMREEAPLPTTAPDLPDEVTHVWAMSTWDSGTGMRWSPDQSWQRFEKRLTQQQ